MLSGFRMRLTGVYDRKTGECKREGRVTQAMMRSWIDRSGIELRGGGLDESPDCYKRLDEVLASVSESVRILHRLTPVGVAMASAKEFDPYKD
jgi:tRNA-splicing ligase RtcB